MPMDGGMLVLPRLIPQKIAMGMLLTGNRISAQEAATHGLVNEVVPAAELDDAVDRWVTQILKCAPLSVKAIKECVKETSDLPLDEAMAKRLPSLIAALQSEDGEEGPRAFRDKRDPVWKGR
jgi:crotonobetainyl-CoA hydratase